MKEFGSKYYKNTAYFNFDHDENLKSLFVNAKDPKRIIEQLIFINGDVIKPEDTLIIFDEIQECPDALNSLKYFNEDANEYHIIAAGSLLGIRLSKTSFPVGKVQFLNMYPMTFNEFLIADGLQNLVDYKNSINNIEQIPDIFFNRLTEKLKQYLYIGGMPEVVDSYINEKNIKKVREIQNNILIAYEQDFSKHVSNIEANKISLIWNSLPSQLARENKKFLYQVVKDGARAREYEDAINWLNDSNEILKVYNVRKNAIPLKSYDDLSSFKLYFSDVGLLSAISNLDSSIVINGNKLFTEFKGALTENFVAEELTYILNYVPNYYTFDRSEIDFIIQYNNEIIPIEVKSGENFSNSSLSKYNEKNNNGISVRFSLNNLKQDGKILNIPLFMIEEFEKIIRKINI